MAMFQIGVKNSLFFINKVKMDICLGEEIVGTSCEKENKMQKRNQTEFRVKKVIKKKDDKLYMWSVKVMTTFFTVGLIKKILSFKMSYFPEPYTYSKNKIEVELDLPNYATKYDWKNKTGVDTSDFAKKTDLANLKSDVDKLDIDKLEKSTKWSK